MSLLLGAWGTLKWGMMAMHVLIDVFPASSIKWFHVKSDLVGSWINILLVLLVCMYSIYDKQFEKLLLKSDDVFSWERERERERERLNKLSTISERKSFLIHLQNANHYKLLNWLNASYKGNMVDSFIMSLSMFAILNVFC